MKKKPGSKGSSKKSGGQYNEGAEENKGWLNDDAGAVTHVTGSSSIQPPKINPNSYEIEDNMKVEVGGVMDGKK